jgi:hypothetical protein
MKPRILLATAAIAMLPACGGPPHKIHEEWMVPVWRGKPFQKLLIIGVYDDRTYRASAETGFVEELKALGVAAQPSYDVIPDLDTIDTDDKVAQALSSRKSDAVLTVATIDPDSKLDYQDALEKRGLVYLLGGRPGPFTDMGGYRSWAGSGHYTLHVALWNVDTQKPIWQATTKSHSTDSESGDIKALADFVVATLRKKGLL